MNPGEHETMARVESRHWWYQGLHDLVSRILAEPSLRPPPGARVLDAGCGTGGVLRLLGERLQPAYLGGFDPAPEAVALAARAAPTADVYVSDLCEPEIRSDDLDLVVSLDVLCIPGVAQAREGLRRLAGQLRPGGLLILNLPAYRWLYSEHDAAVHTSERYTARELRALIEELGFELEILSYRLCLLFPLVVLARLPRLRRVEPGDPVARSDLHAEPGRLMNRLLLAVLRLENRGIARGVRLPFGSSVFAVARKPR